MNNQAFSLFAKTLHIVNANTRLKTKLSAQHGDKKHHYCYLDWDDIDTCKQILQQSNAQQTIHWLLCQFDDGIEILDFIPLLATGNHKICVLDERSTLMPSLWLSYFAEGAYGLLVKPNYSTLANSVTTFLNGYGVLQLPCQSLKILQHPKKISAIPALERYIAELLFDTQ